MVVSFLTILQWCLRHQAYPWINDPFRLSTDACGKTGAGGYFRIRSLVTSCSSLAKKSTSWNRLRSWRHSIWGPALRGQRFIVHCDSANSNACHAVPVSHLLSQSLLDLALTGTMRDFCSQWKCYFSFCSSYSMVPLPATPMN